QIFDRLGELDANIRSSAARILAGLNLPWALDDQGQRVAAVYRQYEKETDWSAMGDLESVLANAEGYLGSGLLVSLDNRANAAQAIGDFERTKADFPKTEIYIRASILIAQTEVQLWLKLGRERDDLEKAISEYASLIRENRFASAPGGWRWRNDVV